MSLIIIIIIIEDCSQPTHFRPISRFGIDQVF